MKPLVVFLTLLVGVPLFASPGKEVKLVSWNAGSCDESSDPYRLINRISFISLSKDELRMTIGFSDNCCAKFNPGVRFSNDTLYIESFVPTGKEGVITSCGCECCFSLDLVISGLRDTSFVTVFDGRKIVYSKEPYKVYPLKYVVRKGDTINRTNKYGAHVGMWILEYPSGKVKSEELFENDPAVLEGKSVWRKAYYEKGTLSSYHRNDSMESWHENGQPWVMVYMSLDDEDQVTSKTIYYSSGKLKEVHVDRYYAEKNQVTDTVRGGVAVGKWDRSEKYYENGQWEYLMGDTTRWWFEDGTLKKWDAGDTATEYYQDGKVKEQHRSWSVKSGLKGQPYFDHHLYIGYHPNGNVATIHYSRDVSVGERTFTREYYDWKWDENGQVLREPKAWEGPLPSAPR